MCVHVCPCDWGQTARAHLRATAAGRRGPVPVCVCQEVSALCHRASRNFYVAMCTSLRQQKQLQHQSNNNNNLSSSSISSNNNSRQQQQQPTMESNRVQHEKKSFNGFQTLFRANSNTNLAFQFYCIYNYIFIYIIRFIFKFRLLSFSFLSKALKHPNKFAITLIKPKFRIY